MPDKPKIADISCLNCHCRPICDPIRLILISKDRQFNSPSHDPCNIIVPWLASYVNNGVLKFTGTPRKMDMCTNTVFNNTNVIHKTVFRESNNMFSLHYPDHNLVHYMTFYSLSHLNNPKNSVHILLFTTNIPLFIKTIQYLTINMPSCTVKHGHYSVQFHHCRWLFQSNDIAFHILKS